MANISLKKIETGYTGLANVLKNRGTDLFHTFAESNTRNLIYMQAEILHLEQQLAVVTALNNQSADPARKAFEKRASALFISQETGDPGQWHLILRIRERLKEYNEALLRQAELRNLPRARQHDSDVLQLWLHDPEKGASFLEGVEAKPWQGRCREDLVALSNRNDFDSFSRTLAERCLPWVIEKSWFRLSKILPGMDDSEDLHVSDQVFRTSGRILSVLLSSVIPFSAVIALYFIPSMVLRLVSIMAFSFLFSSALAVFTSARPVEIFAGTAAFASVQVVFVGSTNLVG